MTDKVTNLTIFVAGTKAKANEVNDNFSALQTATNSLIDDVDSNTNDISNLQSNKANKAGDSSQAFNVADASNDYNAVNLHLLNNKIAPLKYMISGLVVRKDANYNNTYSISNGSCYSNEPSNSDSTVLTLSNSTTGQTSQANTIYNIYIAKNASTNQDEITSTTGSDNPDSGSYTCWRKIGEITTNSEGNIDSIDSYGVDYNEGHGIQNILDLIGPDYSQTKTTITLDKDGAQPYWIATSDGWLMASGSSYNLYIGESGLSTVPSLNVWNIIAFVNKGDCVYSTSTTSTTYYFYPCKGAQ